MNCRFFMVSDDAVDESLKYVKEMGMSWITDKDLFGMTGRIMDIEFVQPPEMLVKYGAIEMPKIFSLTAVGIGFYLILPPIEKGRAVGENSTDGVLFFPMSNIKFISSFGGLDANKMLT